MQRFSFKNLRLKTLFQRFILKVVHGYIAYFVFEPQIGENLLDILHKKHILIELSPVPTESHSLNSLFRMTHVLCQE